MQIFSVQTQLVERFKGITLFSSILPISNINVEGIYVGVHVLQAKRGGIREHPERERERERERETLQLSIIVLRLTME